MKKRFTIMLEENTIRKLKRLAAFKTPTAQREELERLLNQYAEDELVFNDTFGTVRKEYKFDDK